MGLLDRAKGWLPGSLHQTDIDLDFHVLSDLYQIPYFFGLWVSDPDLLAMKEETTGDIWSPKVVLFLGADQGVELDIFPVDENDEQFETEFSQFRYKLDNTELKFQRHFVEDNRDTVFLKPFDVEWGFTDDGRLNFTYHNDTRRYIASSVKRAESLGFDSALIEEMIKAYRDDGQYFKETFDLNTAYELIDGKLSKQEDEEGMERGYLGRPDPTTWIFGDDRYTGPMPPPVGKG